MPARKPPAQSNERLRHALTARSMSVEALAAKVGADPKTVGRWITEGRHPQPRFRVQVGKLLNQQPEYLWPGLAQRYLTSPAQSELVAMYPDRASVPREVWLSLLESAEHHIDILVFSGTFLAQTNPQLPDMLAKAARNGVVVRLCFGDPDGTAVALRGNEEGIGATLGHKIKASLSYFTELAYTPNCEVKLHNTTLYSSIFRYDSQAMINPHVFGSPASANPIFHLKETDGHSTVSKYLQSFQQVWESAQPWRP